MYVRVVISQTLWSMTKSRSTNQQSLAYVEYIWYMANLITHFFVGLVSVDDLQARFKS